MYIYTFFWGSETVRRRGLVSGLLFSPLNEYITCEIYRLLKIKYIVCLCAGGGGGFSCGDGVNP